MGGAVLLSSATDLGVSGVFVAIAFAMLVYGVVIGIATWRKRWS